MPTFQYLDLDLAIERKENAYQVRVTNSPAGNADGSFVLPFSDIELENFLLKLGGTQRRVRRVESASMDAAKQFGGRLFDAVFTGSVRDCLTRSLALTEERGVRLRLRLHLDDAPELADLPWEYLYHSPLNRFFALSVNTPLVRYIDIPERIRPLAVTPPLRILAVISNASDYDPLDVEREWTRLSESLQDAQTRGLIVLERLQVASLSALQAKLRTNAYHILHFVGHGGFDERAQDGVLIFQDNNGRGRAVGGQNLGTILYDHSSLRLVVLNACEGARTSRSDPFSGVAPSLIQQGVPAVIAMQFEISDDAATIFASNFYEAVAQGYPVDAALTEVRKTLYAGENTVEWGTPVLYLRTPDGVIFVTPPPGELPKKVLAESVRVEPAATKPSTKPETAAYMPARADSAPTTVPGSGSIPSIERKELLPSSSAPASKDTSGPSPRWFTFKIVCIALVCESLGLTLAITLFGLSFVTPILFVLSLILGAFTGWLIRLPLTLTGGTLVSSVVVSWFIGSAVAGFLIAEIYSNFSIQNVLIISLIATVGGGVPLAYITRRRLRALTGR